MKTRRSLIATVSCAGLALALPLAASATGGELIHAFAGDGSASFGGDGGAATAAALNAPRSVANAPGGGYLIVDTMNNRIRKVDDAGNITTVVGTGVGAYNGDGLPASSTELFEPRGATATGDGGLLIADTENHRVR